MTLQDVLTGMEEKLKELRADDDWCPECKGIGRRYYWMDGEFAERICPDCNGTGKSPAITQAEAALEAVRGAVEREREVWAQAIRLEFVAFRCPDEYAIKVTREVVPKILAILNPVTNGEGVSHE